MPEMRLLIADDHDLIRRGLRDLLHAQVGWQVVAEARNGAEAVHEAARSKPDVVVLDYYMPDFTGIEAAARILRHQISMNVIILTAEDSPEIHEQARHHGVCAVLLKSSADEELLPVISSLGRKKSRRSSPTMGTDGHPSTTPLTRREEQVLQLLASGSTNHRIAKHLGIGVRTVESHRASLNAKCGFKSVAELVRFADQAKARCST